jgi:hypothetical protein
MMGGPLGMEGHFVAGEYNGRGLWIVLRGSVGTSLRRRLEDGFASGVEGVDDFS